MNTEFNKYFEKTTQHLFKTKRGMSSFKYIKDGDKYLQILIKENYKVHLIDITDKLKYYWEDGYWNSINRLFLSQKELFPQYDKTFSVKHNKIHRMIFSYIKENGVDLDKINELVSNYLEKK